MVKKKYDFIIPIGWGCLNAYNLRKNKLQRESLPFDWIWISDIPQITNLISSKFQNFMKKDNLQFVRHNGDADIYRDISTRIEYWHDFMIGEDFDKSYDKIYQKYQRRINRMFYHIKRSESVLWVRYLRIFPDKQKTDSEYMFEQQKDPYDTTIQEFADLQKLYPDKKFDLLLIYTYDKPCETKSYSLSDNINICEIYNSEDLGWKGDEKLISSILKDYDLTFSSKIYYTVNSFIYKIRKLILQLFSKTKYSLKK